jgi:hypothetical protein
MSECWVTVCCAAFTGVSLSLMWVDLFIGRHADHLQFVPAGTEDMYILNLHPQWTSIFEFTAQRRRTFSDEISLVYPFPLLYPHIMGNILINWATTGIKGILYTGCV